MEPEKIPTDSTAMEGGDDEKSRFLAQLEKLDIRDVLYHPENKPMVKWLRTVPSLDEHEDIMLDAFQYSMEERENMKIQALQGIDFDGLKHYNHSELEAFTHDPNQNFVIGKTNFGRFISGKINLDSGPIDVTIKTWDILYPLRSAPPELHPARLSSEITLLMEGPLKPNRYLPKLIGYSIDKKLAVVYDLKARTSLLHALGRRELDWNTRLKVAIQVAHLLEILHSRNITIGSIDPANILLDEENNMKLCEFGFRVGMQVPLFDILVTARRNFVIPEVSTSKGSLTKESDIFALGALLVELISKDPIDRDQTSLYYWAERLFIVKDQTPVDKCLIDDEDIRCRLYEIVMACLDKDPHQRWNAVTTGKKLEDLRKLLDNSNKRQKMGC